MKPKSNFIPDWSKFKKVASDKDSTTLKHPEGHEIKVAHGPLSPKMREKLAALPHMDEGGDVDTIVDGPEQMKVNTEFEDQGYSRGPYQKEPNPEPNAPKLDKNYANGGNVVLEQSKKNPSKAASYAEGTPDAPVSQEDASTQTQAPAGSPIVINVGQPQPGALPPVPAGVQALNAAPPPATDTSKDINYGPALAEEAKGNAPFGTQGAATPTPPPAMAAAPVPATPPAGSVSPDTENYDPYGVKTQSEFAEKGLGEQMGGIAGEAAATQAGLQKQAAIANEANRKLQEQQQNYKTNFDTLNNERLQHINWLESHPVDINHYFSSMGTGGKIASAIGLILGGIGGGMTHSGNAAQSFIEKQIDNDISAQKSAIGVHDNLLAANTRQFGNMRDATDMTKVMMLDATANQLKAAAAKQGAATAMPRAQQQIGALLSQSSNLMGQMAMRRTLMSAGAAGQIPPEQVIRAIVPEGEKAETMKQLKEAEDTGKFKDNLLSAFDKLTVLQKPGNRLTSPVQSSSQIKAIQDPLTAALSKGTAGRFTEQDAGMLDTLWPTWKDSPETVATKRKQMESLAAEKMHFPLLTQWQIDPTKFSKYNVGDKSKLQLSPSFKPK